MSDAFILKKGVGIKDGMGKEIQTPIYIQFVPGIVGKVITSTDKDKTSPQTVNSIEAFPHIVSNLHFENPLTTLGLDTNEDNRYIPLFRGMTDVPSQGDPVLLTKIGKIKYYIGPLNTLNNSPNFNVDTIVNVSPMNLKETGHSRLQKNNNDDLDGINPNHKEIHGDLMFEGRHGNSIRIGSRDVFPYLIFSNGRAQGNIQESIVDGSLISITSNGTLQQHFGGYEDDINEVSVPGFQLASDTVEENGRTIGSMIQLVNPNNNSYPYLYEFGKPKESLGFSSAESLGGSNQILFHSDRITINSKKEDIFISSFNDIHLGAGRNLTISTNEDLIIESRNIYLGSPTNREKRNEKMEPMVLGDQLIDILKKIINGIGNLTVPGPFAGPLSAPINSPTNTTYLTFKGIAEELEIIKSQYHYIEPNDTTSK